jgi:hypothetical protein
MKLLIPIVITKGQSWCNMDSQYIEHKAFVDYIKKLGEIIKQSNVTYAHLYNADKNGALVTLYLSHILQIPILEKCDLHKVSMFCKLSDKVLVVASISTEDLKKYSEYDIAVIFNSIHDTFTPTFFVKEINNLIEFEWERI